MPACAYWMFDKTKNYDVYALRISLSNNGINAHAHIGCLIKRITMMSMLLEVDLIWHGEIRFLHNEIN